MTAQLRLSVLMPVFDTPGPFLEQAVRSAMALGEAPGWEVEILIQDGGSTRLDTLEALRSVGPLGGVDVAIERDSGQAQALNRALARASGEYIGWLNADDVYLPGARNALAVVREKQPDLLYGSSTLIDGAGRTLRIVKPGPWDNDRILRKGCYIFSGAVFWRTELIREASFDESLHFCMDLDLFLRIPTSAAWIRVGEPVAALRLHLESKSGSANKGFASEALRVRRRFTNTRWGGLAAMAQFVKCRITLATQPIRFSRAYSAVRRTKRR